MKKREQFLFFFIPFLWLLAVSSCKKPEDIGLDTLPPTDLADNIYTDTLTVETRTLAEDSLFASQLSRWLLGSYSDPGFGIAQAGIYTQVLLGSTPNLQSGTGTTMIVDSLVLSFAYAGSYGDTFPQTAHVYQLDETLYYDSSYYTNRSFSKLPDELTYQPAGYTFSPRVTDSADVGGEKQPPQLRIRLTQQLADSVFSWLQQAEYKNNDNWKAKFKGIYVMTEPVSMQGKGAILYFNPLSAYSRLTLYYREDTTAKKYDFTFFGAARINHLTHDYTGSPAGAQLNNPASGDTVNYIQSMAGLKVKINFPYLKNLTDSGRILINKAELVVQTAPGTYNSFPVPSELFFSAYDSEGKINFVPDYFEQGYGGTLDPLKYQYRFNISRTLQQLIDGKTQDYGFSLNVLSSSVQANRIIIGSGKDSPNKMKLRVFYTRVNK